MQKHFHNLVLGVSVLPALLVMSAMAEKTEITERQVFSEDAVLDNSNIHGITNSKVGGAIISDNKLVITNTDISNNTSGSAAALYDNSLTAFQDKSGGYSVTIDNSNISGNSAGDFGAVAIFSPGSKVSNSEFTNNTATADYANLGDGAGALFLGSESQTQVYKTSFSGNTSGTIGGAIATRPINYWLDTTYSGKGTNSSAGAKVDIISSQFSNNVAGTRGGAFFNSFYNSDNKAGYAFVKDSTFSNNSANFGGGIFVEGWTDAAGGNAKLWVEESTFAGNSAIKNGGAIYNESTLSVNNTTFGGATSDLGNSAVMGGAIYNDGNTTISNATFLNNKTKTGGYGGAIFNGKGLLTINNSTFKDNIADWDGGAISGNSTYIKPSAKPADFTAEVVNESTTRAYWQSKTGFDAREKIVINNSTFDHNKATVYSGGAVSVYSDATITNSHFKNNSANGNIPVDPTDGGGAIYAGGWARLDITGGDFINNTSNYGGAISTTRAGKENGVYMHIKGAEFEKNTATVNGGAISNNFDDTVLTDLTFRNNTATEKGGAIYNTAIVELKGANTFTGNKAAGVANDIHNLGTLNIASGTTTIDGGITGDGTLTIAQGATLNIGKATISQGTINLGGTLIADLVADADHIFNVATEFKDEGGKLSLAIEKEGTYNLFSDKQFAKAQEQVTSSIYDLDWEAVDGSVVATKKSVGKIVEETGLSTGSATTVSVIADAAAIEEAPKQMKELSVKLQEKLAAGDTAAVEHATKAVHPETESVAQSVSTSVQNTVVNLASARMAAPSVGRNGGDVNFTSGGVWAQGLFNKSKQADAFNGYTRGIAVGLDGTINKHWTVGAGYSFAHSDITGTARDTEIDSNTVFLYGQYKPSAWYVNAIANYTMSDYSEKGTVLDNIPVFGDYDVNSFGGALATGYDFSNGITPELGLRYMHVNANDYANSYGIKTHTDDADFLTGVVGAKYAFNVAATKHTTFMPQLNAGLKYDLLSDKQVATVTMPGLNAYTLDGSRLNRVGGEFGIGLGMQYDNLEVSVNYDIDVRKDYTSQTGMLKFRCNF